MGNTRLSLPKMLLMPIALQQVITKTTTNVNVCCIIWFYKPPIGWVSNPLWLAWCMCFLYVFSEKNTVCCVSEDCALVWNRVGVVPLTALTFVFCKRLLGSGVRPVCNPIRPWLQGVFPLQFNEVLFTHFASMHYFKTVNRHGRHMPALPRWHAAVHHSKSTS